MYLLDTNVLSEVVKLRPNQFLVDRFLSTPEAELFTSVIAIEEIRFGAKIGPPGNKLWEKTEAQILVRVTILELDALTACRAGDLRADWKRKGTPVGYPDGLIAATALRHGLIVVTRNVRHFEHITALTVENWFEPSPGARSGSESPR